MEINLAPMAVHKRIALVAHDNKKQDLVEWARFNRDLLVEHELLATGTTGQILEQELGVPVQRLQSGPLGGDLQIGALVTTGDIDFLVFFWDPLEPHPHDPDVKALLRVAVVWNIPIACNRATADFVVSSALMRARYDRQVPDYREYPGPRATGRPTGRRSSVTPRDRRADVLRPVGSALPAREFSPRSSPVTRCSSPVRAVSMMIGTWRVASRARMMRHTSNPSMTGRFTSRMTHDGGFSVMALRAASPRATTSTVAPPPRSSAMQVFGLVGSSWL